MTDKELKLKKNNQHNITGVGSEFAIGIRGPVVKAEMSKLSFLDEGSEFASINYSGPGNPKDLVTKEYLDEHGGGGGEPGPPGPEGPQGPPGEDGVKGDPGQGVATGGTTNQILAKNSNSDYDTKWIDPSAGGGVSAVTATIPLSSSGGTTPDISIAAATALVNGYMTSVYASKLDGIAAGAEVNVNADWNSSSGDSQILNKPTSMTPTAHAHGNITNTGYLGTDPNIPLITGTAGIIQAGAFGTVATNFAAGNHVHADATQSVAGFLSSVDKTKLDGIATNANNYVLPEATSSVKGGIELFSYTDQAIAAATVSATVDRTYGLQLNADGQGVVNIPWTDTLYSHPTGDGYLHVPATSTTNNGRILTAGATAGSLSWQDVTSNTQVNLTISTDEYIIIGTIADDTKVVADYSYTLPTANKTMAGRIVFIHDTSTVTISNEIVVADTTFDSVVMSADISAGYIRWIITTPALSENPVLEYRKTSYGDPYTSPSVPDTLLVELGDVNATDLADGTVPTWDAGASEFKMVVTNPIYDIITSPGSIATTATYKVNLSTGTIVTGDVQAIQVAVSVGAPGDADIEFYDGDPDSAGVLIYQALGANRTGAAMDDRNVWWMELSSAGTLWLKVTNNDVASVTLTVRVRIKGD